MRLNSGKTNTIFLLKVAVGFPVRNTNTHVSNSQTSLGYIYVFVFYNISPPNFAILLILGCFLPIK